MERSDPSEHSFGGAGVNSPALPPLDSQVVATKCLTIWLYGRFLDRIGLPGCAAEYIYRGGQEGIVR